MIPTAYFAVLLLAFLSGLTTLIGVSLAVKFGECKKRMIIGLGFAAGMMLLISFFELMPESSSAVGCSVHYLLYLQEYFCLPF